MNTNVIKQENDLYRYMAITDLLRKRIKKACTELESMIDGGEECRGKDSQISYIIQLLRGEV